MFDVENGESRVISNETHMNIMGQLGSTVFHGFVQRMAAYREHFVQVRISFFLLGTSLSLLFKYPEEKKKSPFTSG